MTERIEIFGSEFDVAIGLLGDSHVFASGVVVYPTCHFQRILSYLIIEGRGQPISRRRIANLIWSDTASEQANADVRQTVARIRRFQQQHHFEVLMSDPNMFWLGQGNGVYIDLVEFRELIANPGPKAWVRLCEIYGGDLLGAHRPAGQGFEEWLVHHRTALRFDFINAISQAVLPTSLLTHRERHFCASRLLDEDPYHEGAHRALMYEAALNGDFTLLRHVYEECSNVLRRELGVNPTAETVDFYRNLMNRAPAA
ncbi:AfsR/SARP family transcriptional regulator [Devosia sp. A369]